MKKRTLCLLVIWAVLCLILSIIYPAIKEAANATRPFPAVGGEMFLWLLPSEVVLAISMLWDKKERNDG